MKDTGSLKKSGKKFKNSQKQMKMKTKQPHWSSGINAEKTSDKV